MMTATLSRLKLASLAAEKLLGPLLVFVISYAHHIYFADDFVSSFFAVFSLSSLLLVMAVDKTGILLAVGLQLAFLGWVAVAEPLNLIEQMLFSTSVSLSLIASYINGQTEDSPQQTIVDTSIQDTSIQHQKDKLWQELFDARQEIKTLYEQKQLQESTLAEVTASQAALESSLQTRITAAVREHEDKLLLMQHHLEVALIEKQQFAEDRAASEEDLKKFGSHMHEMALYQETLRQEILRLEELRAKELCEKEQLAPTATPEVIDDKPSYYESMYRQLKLQFEEKSAILDTTRKELFIAQDELAILQRLQQENLEPTQEEKHLMQELLASQDKLEALKRAQEEELVGYEEVIQGLLNQLEEKSNKV